MTATPGAPSSMSVVRCEHLLYTSAARTLSGRDGFGILAVSRGLPAELRSERVLGSVLAFLPQGGSSVVRQIGDVQCLARYRLDSGFLVVRKSAAGSDDVRRPGNFLVHALLDEHGTLRPREVMDLWNADVPLRTADTVDGPTADLDPIDVPVGRFPELPWDPASRPLLEALVEAVLALPRTARPVALRVTNPATSARLLTHLFACLPPALSAPLSFSTFERDPRKADVDVVTVVDRLSSPVPSGHAVVSAGRVVLHDRDENETAAAALLVDAYLRGEALPDGIGAAATTEDLLAGVAVHRSAARPVQDLTAAELVALVRSAPSWVRGDEQADAVVSVLADDRSAASMSVALGAAIGSGQLRAKTRRLLAERARIRAASQVFDGRAHVVQRLLHAAEDLAGSVDDISPLVTEEAARRASDRRLTSRAAAAAWPHLVRAAEGFAREERQAWLEVAPVRALALRRWSPLGEELLLGFLQSQTTPDGLLAADVRVLVEGFPDESAACVDEHLRAARGSAELDRLQDRLLAALGVVPAFGLLLGCGELPEAYLLNVVLPRVADETERREVLRRFWPDLAAQAGMSPGVVELLGVLEPDHPLVLDDEAPGGRRLPRLIRRARPAGHHT